MTFICFFLFRINYKGFYYAELRSTFYKNGNVFRPQWLNVLNYSEKNLLLRIVHC